MLSLLLVKIELAMQISKIQRMSPARAGYGGGVVAEMDKLKTMVRKTEDRQQLGELMALVAEKATCAVAAKPERSESKVSFPSASAIVCPSAALQHQNIYTS